MIAVSSAAVRSDTVRRSARGCTTERRPSLITARTTRGSINVPPLAMELAAAAICTGVTPTWYPMETDASALESSRDGFQTMPGLSPRKSGAIGCPNPKRLT